MNAPPDASDTPVEPSRFSWPPAPPRPIVAAHVAVVMLPLIVVLLAAKVHAYFLTCELFSLETGILDLAGLLGPELVFLSAYALIWQGILSVLPRFDRRKRLQLPPGVGESHFSQGLLWWALQPFHASLFICVVTFFQAITLIILFFAFGGHVYFVLQGIPLDGYMAVFAYNNLAHLAPLIATKVPNIVFVAIFTGLALLFMTPFVLRMTKTAKRWAKVVRVPSDWKRPSASWSALGPLGFMVIGSFLWTVPVSHDLQGMQSLSLVPMAKGVVDAYKPEDMDGVAEVDLGAELQISREKDTAPPNVVVIILESIRARSTTPYNPKLKTMPYLASLADKGATATHAYTVVPHTSKALVSILCGIYPKLTTVIAEAVPGGIPTRCLADLLGKEGYRTGYFQTATQTFEDRPVLVDNFGFETFHSKETLPLGKWESPNYLGPEDMVMVAPSLEWVAESKKPFFLTYLTMISHHDYKVPSRFKTKRYVENELLNDYLNTLAYTDTFVQAVIEGLTKQGAMDNTLVVLVGDHGEAFGEHGRHEHDAVIYDEALQVPLILYGAGITPKTTIPGLRQTIDIVPTVLEVLGYKITSGALPGRSLLQPQGHPSLFHSCWYQNGCMAVRDGALKTIYHYKWHPPQVFNTAKDPEERVDLYKPPRAKPYDVDEAVSRMNAWRKATNQKYRAHRARLEKASSATKSP